MIQWNLDGIEAKNEGIVVYLAAYNKEITEYKTNGRINYMTPVYYTLSDDSPIKKANLFFNTRSISNKFPCEMKATVRIAPKKKDKNGLEYSNDTLNLDERQNIQYSKLVISNEDANDNNKIHDTIVDDFGLDDEGFSI